MPHYRFPTFVWRDASGAYNASLLEWSEPVAFGRTLRDALEDLREYVAWRYRDCPWLDAPDLDDVRHEVLRVPVRPEYGDEKRRYPLPEPILLRVHCVHGKQSHGQRLAAQLAVQSVNEPGSLAQITQVIAENDGNIDNIRMARRAPDFTDMTIDIAVYDLKHLTAIIAQLRALPVVARVERVNG